MSVSFCAWLDKIVKRQDRARQLLFRLISSSILRALYKMKKIAVICALCLIEIALGSSARATDQLDLSVAFKTIPLLKNKINGDAKVAIIFDPTNAVSVADANGIKNLLNEGFEAPGGVKLVPILVAVTELSTLSGVRLALLTSGLSQAEYESISIATSAHEILTISTDLTCVKAAKCILGIVTEPHGEIYYSPAAAAAASISFTSAFTMIVKQQ